MQFVPTILTVSGAILAFIATLYSGNIWLGGFALFMTIIGAIWQYLLTKPFVKNFSEQDWTQSAEGYLFSVPAKKHLRGQGVSSAVYGKTANGYEVVICDEVMETDRFFIRALKPFEGKIILK